MRQQAPTRPEESVRSNNRGFANVIAFPAIRLSKEDEDRIIAKAYLAGYACARSMCADGNPAIVLLNGRREVRGYVTKKHCVYAVLDARESTVAHGRSLSEVLTALEK